MLSLTLKGRYTPLNTIRGQSVLFTVQCCHWDSNADIPPPHSTLSEDRVSLHCSLLSLRLKGSIPPSFGQLIARSQIVVITEQWTLSEDRVNTSRGQSDLFTVQCCHWHSKADIPPVNTSRGQSDLFTVQCCHWHSKADIPPSHSTLSEDRVISSLFNVVWHSKGRYTPPVNTREDRVISSLFNVVIETQRPIYPRSQHYAEDRVISSLFSVVIDTQRQISLHQFDLFTVQCCHWDSKADITPRRVFSSLFNCKYIYRRQIVVRKMAISHFQWHLVVNNGNFTFLLTSSGQEWQFYISTDI